MEREMPAVPDHILINVQETETKPEFLYQALEQLNQLAQFKHLLISALHSDRHGRLFAIARHLNYTFPASNFDLIVCHESSHPVHALQGMYKDYSVVQQSFEHEAARINAEGATNLSILPQVEFLQHTCGRFFENIRDHSKELPEHLSAYIQQLVEYAVENIQGPSYGQISFILGALQQIELAGFQELLRLTRRFNGQNPDRMYLIQRLGTHGIYTSTEFGIVLY